jgi:PEGA domain-containing protein
LDKRPNRLRSYVVTGVIAGSLVLSQTSTVWAQAKPAAAAASPPASAKADLSAAKKRYADGEKKFKAGDFAGALAEFKEANDIKSTPHAERYIGLCEDSLGHYRAAADWYDKFLTHVPDKLASQGDEIRKRDGEIKAMPGKVHIESTPSAAAVSIDDKPQGAATPTDVDLAPGSHTVKIASPGRLTSSKAIDVAFASTQTVSADLDPDPAAAAPAPAPAAVAVGVAPAPAVTPAPPPPPEPRSKVPAIVTGALAVAAAGVGTVFGIIALGDKSDFDKNPTTQTADDGDTHALIADMAFGVALTFGVTSAVLFLTRDETPVATSSIDPKEVKKAAVTVTPTPMVGPHSGGAGFVLRF